MSNNVEWQTMGWQTMRNNRQWDYHGRMVDNGEYETLEMTDNVESQILENAIQWWMTMVDARQWWMVDNGEWYLMQNNRQWRIPDNGKWQTLIGEWWTMNENGENGEWQEWIPDNRKCQCGMKDVGNGNGGCQTKKNEKQWGMTYNGLQTIEW